VSSEREMREVEREERVVRFEGERRRRRSRFYGISSDSVSSEL
jgi:hypothetical protein